MISFLILSKRSTERIICHNKDSIKQRRKYYADNNFVQCQICNKPEKLNKGAFIIDIFNYLKVTSKIFHLYSISFSLVLEVESRDTYNALLIYNDNMKKGWFRENMLKTLR